MQIFRLSTYSFQTPFYARMNTTIWLSDKKYFINLKAIKSSGSHLHRLKVSIKKLIDICIATRMITQFRFVAFAPSRLYKGTMESKILEGG